MGLKVYFILKIIIGVLISSFLRPHHPPTFTKENLLALGPVVTSLGPLCNPSLAIRWTSRPRQMLHSVRGTPPSLPGLPWAEYFLFQVPTNTGRPFMCPLRLTTLWPAGLLQGKSQVWCTHLFLKETVGSN